MAKLYLTLVGAGLALPSAKSGDLFGNRQVFFMIAAKGLTDSVGEFLSRQDSVGLDNSTLGVNPLWLDWVQPGALDRQATDQDANAFSTAPNLAEGR